MFLTMKTWNLIIPNPTLVSNGWNKDQIEDDSLFRWLYNYKVVSSVGNDAVVNWLFEALERDIWKWSATRNDASLSQSRARWRRWVIFLTEGIVPPPFPQFMGNPRALSYNEKSNRSSPRSGGTDREYRSRTPKLSSFEERSRCAVSKFYWDRHGEITYEIREICTYISEKLISVKYLSHVLSLSLSFSLCSWFLRLYLFLYLLFSFFLFHSLIIEKKRVSFSFSFLFLSLYFYFCINIIILLLFLFLSLYLLPSFCHFFFYPRGLVLEYQ